MMTPSTSNDSVLQVLPGFSWRAEREQDWGVQVTELPVQPLEPQVIPLRLRPIAIKTTGFQFPESPAWGKPKETGMEAGGAKKSPPPARSLVDQYTAKAKKLTRIKPPRDIVKLQDRLYYLLQPPLEQILGSGELTFPFEPFPYQFDGIAFLFPRYAAVLADEMGLGKTMQAISTMRMLLWSSEVRNVLLVCPKPLVTNWQRELSVWAPEIPVAVIEGDAARRHWLWSNPAAPIKIANYELLMRDRELIESGSIHFDLVALDEAQRIKNKNSTTAEIARSIPRTRSWALTGTPIENTPEDLVGIFEFLSPGYLRSEMNLKTMAQAAGDFILRRTKDMVLEDMPPKMFRDADLDLTPQQWATYETAEKEGVINLQEMEENLTIQHVFELVLRLKQICNFDPVTGASSKLERLVADMEEIAASGHKAIVFSQWVNSIDQMRPSLERFNPVEYHGRIPHKQRDGVIARFKNDPNCKMILMSYGAGSVGLNLQFCQYVFLFDRWWNPAIEDQAINRAHRIGAAGPVTVTRMLALNTIEQRISDVLDMKRELFNAVFSEAEGPKQGGLTRNEIFGLFNLRTPSGPIKKVA